MIDVTALHEELEAAGLPVLSVNSELTSAEQTTAQTVIDAHDPAKRERDDRTARETAKRERDGLNAYLNLNSPTQAQTVAALKAVIRVVFWLVRNELK